MVYQKLLFTAVVLAADRRPDDPVAKASGVPCKSLTPVCGIPMVVRVLDALADAKLVNRVILCGPDRQVIDQFDTLSRRIFSNDVIWVGHEATPATSTYHVLQSISQNTPVLVTTADHALLNAEVVDYFCIESLKKRADVVVGLASHKQVSAAYPEIRRTAIKLKEASYCSCNLFAFLTSRSRKMADLWRRVEQQRKKPWRLVRLLGWQAVVRYMLGELTFVEIKRRIHQMLKIRADNIVIPFPEAAVDVDTVSDWKFVETIAKCK
jgi:GTP:adenosylcobinamide-phosphate guanylyltransferase